METLIVVTDFSDATENALTYLGHASAGKPLRILLLHVYTIPITYTWDGMALIAMREALDITEERLEEEKEWIEQSFPHLVVETKAVAGDFIHSLITQIRETRPELIIIGVSGGYENLWDTDMLEALVRLPVPVLAIPSESSYKPVMNIAYACNYKRVGMQTPVDDVKKLVMMTGAKLHVVHVGALGVAKDLLIQRGEHLLRQLLDDINPEYHFIEDVNVIHAIEQFITKEKIDCLIVVPQRHGIWEKILNRSQSKTMARINHVPVIALHDR
jgi:hypothetical protein